MKNLNTVQQTELDAILDSEDFKNIFDNTLKKIDNDIN